MMVLLSARVRLGSRMLLVGVAAIAAPIGSARAAGPARTTVFTAVLNGGQVVPPSSSNAFGVGYLYFDGTTKRLCYSISFSATEGLETEAHIHGGATNATDAVFFDLPLGSPKKDCVGPLSPLQEKLLKKGRTYINIHTTVWVAGELRGQIVPAPGVR